MADSTQMGNFLSGIRLFLLTCVVAGVIACRPAGTPEPLPPRTVTSMPTPAPTGHVPEELRPSTPPPAPPTSVPPSLDRRAAEPSPTADLSGFPPAPLPLSAYPRPPDDNGLGVHWSTHLYAQSDEATSYFVSELARMNIKWVKLLNDGVTGREYDHTIDELVGRGIMPILRIYQQCNTPYDPQLLETMVRHYTAKGVYYFETYNEPNLPGESGGWCDGDGAPQPEYLARIWANAVRVIYRAGGYPSLPSFFAPGKKQPDWHDSFFYRFFDALREQGNTDVLYFSWAAVHNYTLNHPPTYPYDEVNQTGRPLTGAEIARYNLSPEQAAVINRYRAVAAILKTRPLTPADGAGLGLSAGEVAAINRKFAAGELMGFTLADDSTGFMQFMAYHNQFYDLFGFDIPILSTEGGATHGSAEDTRYPPVDGKTVAEWTLWIADYMLDDAPDYYFVSTTWLLAQAALDYPHPIWEPNAWYHNREGDQEPVVEALKQRPRRLAVRRLRK